MENFSETNRSNSTKNKIKKYIPVAILFISFLMVSIIMRKYTSIQCINSDDASELILGKILSEDGGILSKAWYYSTELRVLNTQIIWALLFKFTDNWRTVRVVGTIILYVIFVVSYLYMCSKVKIDKKLAYLSAALMLLPISSVYFDFILQIPYYIPHIAISFFALGMTAYYVELNEQKNKKIIYLILMTVLALVAGLGGLRSLLNCYIPLFFAAITLLIQDVLLEKRKNPDANFDISEFNDEKKWVIVSSLAFIFSVIGYIINSKILSKIYTFADLENISFIEFSFSNLENVIKAWLLVFGYDTGAVFSISLIRNLVCFIMIVLACFQLYYIIKKPMFYSKVQRLLCWFTFFAFLAQSVMNIISDSRYRTRYMLLISIFIYPMIAILYQNTHLKKTLKRTVGILLFALIFFTSSNILFTYKDKDLTKAKREVTAFLLDNNYSEGYATFWEANVLTELSNGAIDMYSWEGDIKNVTDIDQMFKWLQKVEHINKHPQTAPFIVLTKDEFSKWELGKQIDRSYLIYESPQYIIFGFPDYDTMEKDLVTGYELGTDIMFYGDSYNATEYVEYGISEREENFSWTDRDSVKLRFSLNSDVDKLKGFIELDTVFNNTQDVTIIVNNEEVYHNVVNSGENIEFDFNGSQDKCYDIEILLPQAISPKDLGMSNDERKLALAIKSVVISERH